MNLQELREEIARIERGAPGSFGAAAALRRRSARDGQADGAFELDPEGTHEIKPAIADVPVATAAGFAAALAFALRLAGQAQLQACKAPGTILICVTSNLVREIGSLYGPGLEEFGLSSGQFVVVETAKRQETLWAMEEGLKSRALLAVVGCLDEAGLTPARRLSLAAKAYATPCLIVTNARTPTAAATAWRWRVGMRPGAASQFDTYAPGDGASAVVLEKGRFSFQESGCSLNQSRGPVNGVPGGACRDARAGILQAGRFRSLPAEADGQDPGNRSSVTKTVSGDAVS